MQNISFKHTEWECDEALSWSGYTECSHCCCQTLESCPYCSNRHFRGLMRAKMDHICLDTVSFWLIGCGVGTVATRAVNVSILWECLRLRNAQYKNHKDKVAKYNEFAKNASFSYTQNIVAWWYCLKPWQVLQIVKSMLCMVLVYNVGLYRP